MTISRPGHSHLHSHLPGPRWLCHHPGLSPISWTHAVATPHPPRHRQCSEYFARGILSVYMPQRSPPRSVRGALPRWGEAQGTRAMCPGRGCPGPCGHKDTVDHVTPGTRTGCGARKGWLFKLCLFFEVVLFCTLPFFPWYPSFTFLIFLPVGTSGPAVTFGASGRVRPR